MWVGANVSGLGPTSVCWGKCLCVEANVCVLRQIFVGRDRRVFCVQCQSSCMSKEVFLVRLGVMDRGAMPGGTVGLYSSGLADLSRVFHEGNVILYSNS